MLRMPPYAFEHILGKIAHKICKEDTPMRNSITAPERLSVTLKFLATGMYVNQKNNSINHNIYEIMRNNPPI